MYHRKHIGSSVCPPVCLLTVRDLINEWTDRQQEDSTLEEEIEFLQGYCSLDVVVSLLLGQPSDWFVWLVSFVGCLEFWGVFLSFMPLFLFQPILDFSSFVWYRLWFTLHVLCSSALCHLVFWSFCFVLFCRYACLHCTEIEFSRLSALCTYIETQQSRAALSI